MRQFFTLRFWAAVGAVVGAALLVYALVGRDDAVVVADQTGPVSHRIDRLQLVAGLDDPTGLVMEGGRVSQGASVILADASTVLLTPGTPGEVTCEALDVLGGCIFAADMLGDGVVWFSLSSAERRDGTEMPLPPIVELLDGVTWARLDNGWEVPLLAVVSRRCDVETSSLGDFVDRFGLGHETIFDLEAREVSAVRCLGTGDASSG